MTKFRLSAQLAVLAAAAVDGGVGDGLVALRLAGDAGAHPGERLAALRRNRLAAIVAFLGTLPLGGERTGAKDRVLHRVVDLVLDRAVASPSAGHIVFLSSLRGAKRRGNPV